MLVEVYNSSEVIQERSVRISEKHIEEEQDDDDDDEDE